METVLKYLPVIVFYIKCFVSYFTFARTNAKSNEYLTRLRHPEFRTYWGHKILLAALDFTTKGTFYLIALFIWIFPGSQDLLLNILYCNSSGLCFFSWRSIQSCSVTEYCQKRRTKKWNYETVDSNTNGSIYIYFDYSFFVRFLWYSNKESLDLFEYHKKY